MADDEFDIDIYGDANTEQESPVDLKKDEEGDVKIDGAEGVNGHPAETNGVNHEENIDDDYVDIKVSNSQNGNSTPWLSNRR